MAALVTRRLTVDYVMLDAADGKVLITASGVGAEAVAEQLVRSANSHDRLVTALKAALGPLDAARRGPIGAIAASTAWMLAYDALREAEAARG